MEISLIYLIKHLGQRIVEFFRHWYLNGFLKASDISLTILERLDRTFALRISIRYLFSPLYQDYSFIGYMWGFIFRAIRIILASVVYSIFVLFSFVLFVVWTLIPIFIIYNIIVSL